MVLGAQGKLVAIPRRRGLLCDLQYCIDCQYSTNLHITSLKSV
jgi:hypothetical protein